jgi:murein DD-endopeptidase MepM/ murein hydrolase activator NlpD
MIAKQHFTITITDVHGARHYSFSQLVKKFVWVLLVIFFMVVVGGATAIWWLNKEVEEIQTLKRQAEMSFLKALDERQNEYANLVEEKAQLINELEEKIKQVGFLDQTLQGLEELIGVQPEMDAPIFERVKMIQLTTLEKQIMLERLPNGRPVGVFRGVTSGYGWRTHPVRGTREFHYGIDYRGERGAPVLATADGVVEYAGYHRSSGYGNLVIISHAYGFKTFYGHLHSMNVKTGQFINKGDLVGGIGSTGVSTGPHLHYEVNFVHRKLNPAPFVQWSLEDYDSIFDKVEGIPWGSLSQTIRNHVERVEKQLLLRDVQ